MLVKSSAESIELAFNTAEYCCKKLFKSEEGGRYNKWYCYGVEFGQNYAWFKVEHTDYSVRLSFEFMDTGFVYVDGYFTNGSSYDKKTITSWRFDNESEDVAADKVKDVLDRFFDEGINVLRGEEVINSSHRPVKSSANNLPSKVYYMVVQGAKMYYSTDYDKVADMVQKINSKPGPRVYGPYTETDPEEIQELYEVGYIGNSRKVIKSSAQSDYDKGADYAEEQYQKYVEGGIDAEDIAAPADCSNDFFNGFNDKILEYKISSSRKPVKSLTDNIEEHGIYHNDTWQLEVVKLVGNTALLKPVKDDSYFCVKNPKIDEQGDLVWTSDTLPMTDYDTALKEFNYHKDLNNVSPTFNSRRAIKSSAAPDGLTFINKTEEDGYAFVEYKVTDKNLLDRIKNYCSYDEDELQFGNVFMYFMYDIKYDKKDTLLTAQVIDTESSTWDLSPEECVEIFGSDIMTYLDPGVGKHAVDEFTDYDVDPETVKSSRKPIKSANYNGFNLEARRSYGKGNGYFTTYPVWDTDLDTSIGAIEYHYAVENPYYVAWVYNDFGANKTGRTKAFDTEEECLEWIGEELASGTTARDKLLKYWEELGYDYKSKNLNNSRKPVKSDWKREAEFMNDRIRDDNLLYQVFKIEDEHFGGNFENPDNWDGTHIVYTIENGEITNTEIVDSFEDVIDDGNKYYLSANRDTGYRNTDYVLDRVALWQERNNRGITSSRKPVKSSFIVGKQDNGTKVYFCEDGKYYSENDYSRPSIKIFDSKSEADKMAKRSKSGFISPLEK